MGVKTLIKKIIMFLFVLLTVNSFELAAVGGAPNNLTDKEYPSPFPAFNVANIILNLGTTTSTYVSAMGLIPGGYAEFKVTATNASTYATKLNVSLDNFTVYVGSGVFAPKYGDSVIHTSNDLANATQIAVWIDTSAGGSHTSPQSGDYSLTYSGSTATTTLLGSANQPTFFNVNLINTSSIYWDSSSVPITMLTSSNPYTIHYNISLSGTPNNGIQGEQGILGTSLTLHT